MKKFTLPQFVVVLFFTLQVSTAFSQVPEQFKYQAVLRDATGHVIANESKAVVIDVLEDSLQGNSVFNETHQVVTTAQGIINLNIGSVNTTGLAAINWGAHSYFIKITVGGVLMGTSQLLSVPYALYAKTAGNADNKPKHYIGELFGGGIVFWVSPDGEHGLIMSLDDVSSAVMWSNIIDAAVEHANNLHDGLANSLAIVAQPGHTTSAAKLCLDYTNEGFDDWFLPTSWQVWQIYDNFYILNQVLINDSNPASEPLITKVSYSKPYGHYWTSDVNEVSSARFVDFRVGSSANKLKNDPNSARAVRLF